MKQIKTLLTVLLMLSPVAANATLITNIELIDSNKFEVSMSGILEGSTPGGSTYLFILLDPLSDPTTCGSNTCTANFISGDLQEEGGNAPTAQWVADYIGGPHIQFNWGGFLDAGDVISGSSIFSVTTGHGMTNSDFADAEVYWGYGPEISDGVYQGAVGTSTPQPPSIPEPATLTIFALGMIALASRKLKKQP